MMTLNLTRSEKQRYKALRQTLIDSHLDAREISNRPSTACALLIDRAGFEDAKQIVALMIFCKGGWDTRISDRNREWADEIEPFAEEIATEAMLFYPAEIHPAHLDMIADYLRKL